jgi:phosphoglycolate phosphatase-like HAD superfamily hydrolase
VATLTLPDRAHSISVVGFDVDGVLRETAMEAYEHCCKAISILGGRPPEFADFVHGWSGHLIEYYRSCGVTASNEEIKRVNGGLIGLHDRIAPYEDVVPTLEYLAARGVRMFALSGHQHDPLHKWFEQHGLHVHFDHVQGDGKDKVEHLRALCARMRADTADACYIGDWGQDMRAAVAAMLIPIGITRGHASGDVLRANGAVHLIDQLLELQVLVS